jgi:hypothetical protein
MVSAVPLLGMSLSPLPSLSSHVDFSLIFKLNSSLPGSYTRSYSGHPCYAIGVVVDTNPD